MRLLLELYFAFNLFYAGHQSAQIGWACNAKERWAVRINILVALLFGAIVVPLVLLLDAVRILWKIINDYFQVSFWFMYLFTNEVHRLTDEQLRSINYRAHIKGNKDLNDRIWKYGVKLINKKRNYTYVHKEHEF